MKNEWYYRKAGRIIGPISFALVTESVQSGSLSSSDEIRQGATGPWRKVSEAQSLFSNSNQSPAEKSNQVTTRKNQLPQESDLPTATGDWYCKVNNQVLGPYDADQILQMAQDGTLFPQDPIRQGEAGLWNQYIHFEEQIKGEAAASCDETTAEGADHDRQQGTAVGQQTADSDSRGAQPPAKSGESRDVSRSKRGAGHKPKFQPRKRFKQASRLPVSWEALVALGLLLALNILAFTWNFEDENRVHYRIVLNYSNRMKQLQDKEATELEWKDLLDDAHQQLDPLIKEMEKDVSVKNPVRQHLLWASRDYLLPLIERSMADAKNPIRSDKMRKTRFEDPEEHLQTHLTRIERLLAERR